MRKPVKLNKSSGSFSVSFDDGYTINKNITLSDSKTNISTSFEGGHYIQPPAPDWTQDDPEQLDYIKNKQIAEQYRPVTINGEEFLNEDRSSGALDISSGDGVVLKTNGNSLHLSVNGFIQLKQDVAEIYHQEYEKDSNGDFVLDEENNKIPAGNPTGVLAFEITRAKQAEQSINDKIASLFRVEKDDNEKDVHKGEIVEYVENAIPIATLDKLGRVRSSDAKNQIKVNSKTGVMEINSLSTDKLIQGDMEFVLNGGNTDLTK